MPALIMLNGHLLFTIGYLAKKTIQKNNPEHFGYGL
jgi:hypothetical protein